MMRTSTTAMSSGISPLGSHDHGHGRVGVQAVGRDEQRATKRAAALGERSAYHSVASRSSTWASGVSRTRID